VKANLGTLDRRIRAATGLLLISLSLFSAYFLAAILGAYALLTGVLGWCPVSKMLNVNTFAPKKYSRKKNSPASKEQE